jgi:futalosine hydrolase
MLKGISEMSLKILIVAATDAEAILPSSVADHEFSRLVTGVGQTACSWELCKWFRANSKPDLIINTGIAGSYRSNIETGSVVVPVTDRFADQGVETKDGFMTLAEAGLEDPGRFPFTQGFLVSDNQYVKKAVETLRPVSAITVSTSSGTEATINRLKRKYDPDIETMEGATFFYICAGEKVPFLAFRAISNMVEPRDRSKWNIPAALGNLSEKLNEFILKI